MILGMSIHAFTVLHTAISLVAIAAGLIVAFRLVGSQRPSGLTGFFLLTTVLTSVTGFMFPGKFDPARAVGIISLVVLAIAIYAYYARGLARGWRTTYVTTALVALYLNCFVAVTQSFQKIPALHALAPNGNELPFAVAQGVLLVAFIALGWVSVRKFHPAVRIAVA